jgi:hypothetical protein
LHRGYIALWRKIKDHDFWKEPRVFSKYEAWIDMLMEAQHDENQKQVVIGMKVLTCGYGECLKSNVTWGRRWGWTEAKVRRFLKLLEKMGQIRFKSEGVTTRITLINYASYDPRRRRNDEETTRTRRGCDEDATTDNNVKNVKNVKNTPPYSPPSGDDDKPAYSQEFKSFWIKYPKKVGKDAAWKAWKKIKRPSQALSDISDALDWQIASDEWTKNNGQYIPNPSTYLNQGRWKDEKTEGGINDVFEQYRKKHGIPPATAAR